MMKKVFIAYATAICLTFVYAGYKGWNVFDSVKSGQWSPQGKTHYHK